MKIFVFGNEILKQDSGAKEISRLLSKIIQGVEFIECNSPTDMMICKEHTPIILDVVQGIQKVTLIKSIDELGTFKSSTAHDMDLGFMLKLYKELGTIKDAIIIGVPMNVKKEELSYIIEEIKKIIETLSKNK